MLNRQNKFICYPSVVCVGRETEVTIFPRDITRRFREDKEYELCVFGLGEEEIVEDTDYHFPIAYPHTYTVRKGCMCFTHDFAYEQEYMIRFREKGDSATETKITIYAVEEDLYQLRPLKGDLHSHSYYSDAQDGLGIIPAAYRELGFDFFALTDHNRMFPSELAIDMYKDVPLGIHIMKGEEIHTPDTRLHIVHVGGNKSVCEQYIKHRDKYEEEVDKIAETLTHIPELHRRKTAMAKWSCEKVHEAGGLAIYAHPFWRPNCYNVSKEFSYILFEEVDFDAFEVIDCSNTAQSNQQVALWQEQLCKGKEIPVVSCSDSHHMFYNKNIFGRHFTIVFAKSNTTEDILEAIRNGNSVAGDISVNCDDEVRFYGSKIRLILFAHFLFTSYFKETWRLCYGEGILMRRLAEGEQVGEILAALADTVENFYKRFYGLTPAPVLTEEQLAFLNKCRDVQRESGLLTRGVSLNLTNRNPRRE